MSLVQNPSQPPTAHKLLYMYIIEAKLMIRAAEDEKEEKNGLFNEIKDNYKNQSSRSMRNQLHYMRSILQVHPREKLYAHSFQIYQHTELLRVSVTLLRAFLNLESSR